MPKKYHKLPYYVERKKGARKPRESIRMSVEHRNAMADENRGLVVKMARKYKARPDDENLVDDLIQDGMIGLIRAAELFDPGKELKFSTYAQHWIRTAFNRSSGRIFKPVQLPDYLWLVARRFLEAYDRAKETCQNPDVTAVVDSLGVKAGVRDRILEAIPAILMTREDSRYAGWADGSAYEDGMDFRLSWLPAKEADESPFGSDVREQATAAMARLSPRKREMISMRFGMDGKGERTLQQIGEKFGFTRERARQLIAEALGELREKLGAA